MEENTAVALEEPKKRPRPLKALRNTILFILLAAVLFAAGFLTGKYVEFTKPEPMPEPVVLENKLSEASELVSVDYTYTDMAQFENTAEFYGVKIPFTTKSFLLTYSGCIKAGVDLSEAKVAVAGRTVTVKLPDAKIIAHEIDEESIRIFDERNSIFNPFSVDDYSAFRLDQQTRMELTAIADGLLTEAADNAAEAVRLLLASALPDDCVINVN